MNGVSNHGRGRAENDVKKFHHVGMVKQVLDVEFWILDGGIAARPLWRVTGGE